MVFETMAALWSIASFNGIKKDSLKYPDSKLYLFYELKLICYLICAMTEHSYLYTKQH